MSVTSYLCLILYLNNLEETFTDLEWNICYTDWRRYGRLHSGLWSDLNVIYGFLCSHVVSYKKEGY